MHHTTSRDASTTATTAPAVLPRVAGLGDSLMWMARTRLVELMRPTPITINGVPGRTAIDATYSLNDIDLASTEDLILSIGTNDALHGAPADSFTALNEVADRIASVPCVRWMALTDSSPDKTYDETAHRINDELLAIAARHPNIGIVRWDIEVANHPEWLSSDGIHHSDDGTEQYAELMANELRACPQPKAH